MDSALRDWIAVIVGAALVLAPFVSALVAAVKTAAGSKVPDAYYPLISIAVGTGLARAISLVVPLLTPSEMLFVGALAGLIASGLYAGGKALDRAMR